MRCVLAVLALAMMAASCGGGTQVVEAGGFEWTQDRSAGPDAVVAVGDRFVGSRDGGLLWSNDGLDWSAVDESPEDATVLAGGPSGAVAQSVVGDVARVATSTDGVQWVVTDPLADDRPEEYWLHAAAVGEPGYLIVFVVPAGVVADAPQHLLYTSSDGVVWEPMEAPAELLVLSGVAASPAGFMVVGEPMVDGNPGMMAWFSPDARSWTMQSISDDFIGDADLGAVAWQDGFIAAGASGMWHNPDGRRWLPMDGPHDVGSVMDASDLGVLAASMTDDLDYVFHFSSDGSSWTTLDGDAVGFGRISDAAVGPTRILLSGEELTVGVPVTDGDG